MKYRVQAPASPRHQPYRRVAVTWVTAILVLVFSLAGCDGERDYLHQTTTSFAGAEAFGPEEAEFCTPSDRPDEQPHARHIASDEFVAAGSDTPKARIAPDQRGHAAVEGALAPAAFPLTTGPPTSAGGRDTLTRFCISRR